MTRFVAEFVLDSDIRLPDGAGPLRWQEASGDFELIIENLKPGFSFIEDALRATLVFSANDLNEARERCQDKLASILNAIVLISGSMTRQSRLVRVVDWDPGKIMRDALFFQESPKIAVPLPLLNGDILKSAASIFRSQQKDRTQSALRWFRLGIGGSGLEEQFTYLWFSLETAAEALKSNERVKTKCPKCNGELFCNQCGDHPVHRKFSADAIRDLVISFSPDAQSADTTFKALVKIRHTLMHGRRIETIESSLPFDGQVATNRLAKIARNAIFRMGDYTSYSDKHLELTLIECEDFVRGKVVAAAHIQTTFGPDPDNPTLSGSDGIKVSMTYPGQSDGD